MLFVYAAGAATSLAFALLAGRRLFTALKQTFSAGEWIRRGLGIAVLLAVGAVTFGWDGSLLTRLSIASTNRLEQSLINIIDPRVTSKIDSSKMSKKQLDALPVEGEFPSLSGASSWLNSLPISPDSMRGKVVLIDFWTYSCINCLRSLPYVKAWHEKYKDHGLAVIGVHTPEFAFEKDVDNVRRATGELGLAYPIALDNNYAIWRAFSNQYWPAHYFIDAMGRIRSHHFGEGNYEESERIIRQLLIEAGVQDLPLDVTDSIKAAGIQAASDKNHIQSEETYIGYERAENFISSAGFAPDQSKNYELPSGPELNQWGLAGIWLVDKEKAVLGSASGKIIFRFKARDLHLVMGPGTNGKPVRFRVQLDNAAPELNHGVDIDANGNGVIQEQRLYQLIRQSNDISEHTFSIEFFDSGVQAFAFTFG
jgi:thiol-disulfide isomerase/thioredoxin